MNSKDTTFNLFLPSRVYFFGSNKLRNVPFSPPDMTEAEAAEVRDAILSGWITTGPRTKKLEKEVAKFVGVDKAV